MKRRRKSGDWQLTPNSKRLLASPNLGSAKTLEEQRFTLLDQNASGKHATVLFATRSPTTKVAIKKQVIKSPRNVDDKSYREVFILQQLNTLRLKKEYYPGETNFVGFVDWFKAKEDDQYMHFVLECADLTLNDFRVMSLYEYKCIFFQILFALYVAQKEFEFMHNDLHMKNILLIKQQNANEYCEYRDGKKSWFSTGWMVKITDFGLSRISLSEDHVIYDRKRPFTKAFLPEKDIDDVFGEFTRIKILADTWVSQDEINQALAKDGGEGRLIEDITKTLKETKKLQLAQLRKAQRKGASLQTLIGHTFFQDLQEKKPNFQSPVAKKPVVPIRLRDQKENLPAKFNTQITTGFTPQKKREESEHVFKVPTLNFHDASKLATAANKPDSRAQTRK